MKILLKAIARLRPPALGTTTPVGQPRSPGPGRASCLVRCAALAALCWLNMESSAEAETFDYGSVVVGNRAVREKKESFRWYWLCGSERFDGALLNVSSRMIDNSPPFAFDGSSSFTLRSCFGDKDSGYFKIAFSPTSPGTFTRLLRIRTSEGGEEIVTLIGRGEDPPPLPLTHVDWQYTAPNADGSIERPYRTVQRGYDRTAACGTLKIRTGHYAGRMLLTKCIRLESYAGPAVLGGSGPGGLLAAGDEAGPSPMPDTGSSTPPPSTSVTRRADGTLLLTFRSDSSQPYQVLSSTNLVDWALWKGLDEEDGTVIVGLPDVGAQPMRFFKIVEVNTAQNP